MLQIANGIKKLYDTNDTAHRDVKPQNVLLKLRDESIEVKLSDFGTTKQGGEFFTSTGVGTTKYTAPEIRKKYAAGYTSSVDVYSFGVLLGEVICGKRPEDSSPLSQEQFNNNNFPKDIRTQLYAMYSKCTKDDPSERPNIKSIIDDLNQIKQKIEERRLKIERSINNIKEQCDLQCKEIEKEANNLKEEISKKVVEMESKKESKISSLRSQLQKLSEDTLVQEFFLMCLWTR